MNNFKRDNIVALRKLVLTYRNISEEDILKVKKKHSTYTPSELLQEITGFNSGKCPVCIGALNQAYIDLETTCSNCFWVISDKKRCYEYSSFNAIEGSKTIKGLIDAINKRANFIEKRLKKFKQWED